MDKSHRKMTIDTVQGTRVDQDTESSFTGDIGRYEKGKLNYKLLLNLLSFSDTFIFLICDMMIKKKIQSYYP